jgi:hypothetical protein
MLFSEYFCDLIRHLTTRGEMLSSEEDALLAAVKNNNIPIPPPANASAKAFLLKACLEAGRLRPGDANSPTIDELLRHPLDVPLPR